MTSNLGFKVGDRVSINLYGFFYHGVIVTITNNVDCDYFIYRYTSICNIILEYNHREIKYQCYDSEIDFNQRVLRLKKIEKINKSKANN